MSLNLLKALTITAELTGTELSKDAVLVMLDDLNGYPEEQVITALSRCRKEVRNRVTLADIIARIDDGRPGVEKAWSMIPKDEDSSCLWTDEMREAFGAASPLMCDGDMIGGRMAFKETYEKLCMKARDEKKPINWTVSFGHDHRAREDAVLAGVRNKLITVDRAIYLLPSSDAVMNLKQHNAPMLENLDRIKQIISNKPTETEPEEHVDESVLIARVKAILK
jgi:hypothetical protein